MSYAVEFPTFERMSIGIPAFANLFRSAARV